MCECLVYKILQMILQSSWTNPQSILRQPETRTKYWFFTRLLALSILLRLWLLMSSLFLRKLETVIYEQHFFWSAAEFQFAWQCRKGLQGWVGQLHPWRIYMPQVQLLIPVSLIVQDNFGKFSSIDSSVHPPYHPPFDANKFDGQIKVLSIILNATLYFVSEYEEFKKLYVQIRP